MSDITYTEGKMEDSPIKKRQGRAKGTVVVKNEVLERIEKSEAKIMDFVLGLDKHYQERLSQHDAQLAGIAVSIITLIIALVIIAV